MRIFFLKRFRSCHIILSSLPSKMCQSRQSSLTPYWVHEKILTSTFRWFAPKKWYGKSVSVKKNLVDDQDSFLRKCQRLICRRMWRLRTLRLTTAGCALIDTDLSLWLTTIYKKGSLYLFDKSIQIHTSGFLLKYIQNTLPCSTSENLKTIWMTLKHTCV